MKAKTEKRFVKFAGPVPVEVLAAAIEKAREMYMDRYFEARATTDGGIEIVDVTEQGD